MCLYVFLYVLLVSACVVCTAPAGSVGIHSIYEAMQPEADGGMLMKRMQAYTVEDYYDAFHWSGSGKILRRLQVTARVERKLFESMVPPEDVVNETRWGNMIKALSYFDFGFPVLQAICRTIVVPACVCMRLNASCCVFYVSCCMCMCLNTPCCVCHRSVPQSRIA